jgi:16S rRNA (uracil1498-N3)-methyltransferase
MPRFYIPPAQWNPEALMLDADEAHHALDVLRLKIGERVTAFDGQGREATAEIVATAKGRVDLRVLHQGKTPRLGCELVLGQAIPKGRNMDLILEKATELGAAEIAPLLSERTVVRLAAADARDKQEKWQRVVIEAAKQCGQNWLPDVAMPVTLKAFFDAKPRFDLMLIASLQPGAQHLKKVLADYAAEHPYVRKPRRVLVLVGPEGDFTPAEIALAKGAGCQPITLGPIILRTETAALYCLSVLGHELL